MNGYLAEDYAWGLKEVGRPKFLQHSGSWVLERAIPDSAYKDLAGCYPLMLCSRWSGLKKDLLGLKRYASFTMVADPLADISARELRVLFPDLFEKFKSHHLVDLDANFEQEFSSNHVRNAKKALKTLVVRREENTRKMLGPWTELYANLVRRHNITGVSAFSDSSFEAQLRTPGMVVYSACLGDEVVGIVLYYKINNCVYYHLGAYTSRGYDLKASFGIFKTAIQDFSDEGILCLNLGGGAGLSENSDDGLTRFKRGWANTTRPAYLCGKILNQDLYDELVAGRIHEAGQFFPAYRRGM